MKVQMTKKAWENIGKEAGWDKVAFGGVEWIELGPNPSAEDCAQVGSDNYNILSRMEARAYIGQLKRQFPNIPEGASFGLKSFPHDFGRYYEVVVKFRMDDEEAENFAYEVENNTPENWDDQARSELESQGYFEKLKGSGIEGDQPSDPYGIGGDYYNNLGLK